ncbi:MAG: ChuX/HutX family heme-like substrate-binding protein [Pseudomonadota bacterium]
MKITSSFVAVLLYTFTSMPAQAEPDDSLCATYFEKQIVRNHYFGYGGNPAAPPPIPSHDLRLVETKVVSALPATMAVSAQATPKRFNKIWNTIDAWGADKDVKIIITVDGWHAFAYPGKVPITKAKSRNGFYVIESEGGAGMRHKINTRELSSVYAVKLEASNGRSLRNVSFYDKRGDLVFAVHATEPGYDEDPDLVAAFDQTWAVVDQMPSACTD